VNTARSDPALPPATFCDRRRSLAGHNAIYEVSKSLRAFDYSRSTGVTHLQKRTFVMTTQNESPPEREWPRKIFAITLFAEDMAATKQFYVDVFALPVAYEDDNSAVFDFGNIVVNLLDAREGPELIGPAQVADPEGGARMQLTIPVDDVDAVCARLAEQGIPLLNGPMDRPWGIRTATFRDPAGTIWEIAADL
jgi:lactoylglutathione lyase